MKYVLILSLVLYALYWPVSYQDGTFEGTKNLYIHDYNGYPAPLYALTVRIADMSGDPYSFMWWLGVVSMFATILLFYKSFNIRPIWWHVFLFIPAIAVLATRSSQGPVVLLVLLAYCFFRYNRFWVSALFASLAVFFRSELIVMPVLLGFVTKTREYIIVPILLVGMWWAFSGYPARSDGLAVAYINLGVSSDNPYRVVFSDSTSISTVKNFGGHGDPFHRDNAGIFFWRYMAQIREHPVYFAFDSLRKTFRVFFTRIWVGDENMNTRYSWPLKYLRVLFSVVLWGMFFFVRKDLFVSVFAFGTIILSAFVGGTLVINAIYLLMLGVIMEEK